MDLYRRCNAVGGRAASDERGFTLIELLVVITILGILAGVVVFSVQGIGDKGKDSATAADEATLRTAEEAHCAKFNSYASVDELIAKKFLNSSSVYNSVSLGSEGDCGDTPGRSSYSIFDAASPTTVVGTVSPDDLGGADLFPYKVAVNERTNKVYVARFGGGIAVVDGRDNSVKKLLTGGGLVDTPGTMAVDPENNRIYVACNSCNGVSVINGADDTVVRTVSTTEPALAMAINPANHKLYIATESRGFVLASGATSFAALDDSLGSPSPTGSFGVNTQTNKVYAWARTPASRLLVIDGATNAVSGTTVQTASSTETAQVNTNEIPLVNQAANRVYLAGIIQGIPTASDLSTRRSKTWVINGANNSVVASKTEASNVPERIGRVFSPSTRRVYSQSALALGGSIVLAEYNPATNTYTGQIGMFGPGETYSPEGLLTINPNNHRVYAPGDNNLGLVVVNLSTRESSRLLGGRAIYGLAVNTTTNRTYITTDEGKLEVLAEAST